MLRCTACPDRDRVCPPPSPTGPKPCRVMAVGEGPSVMEIKQGKVFVGQTGQELDGQYLKLAGIDRADVYVTNASKCPGRTKTGAITNPTVEQARTCAAYWLPIELREVQPEIVILMGAIACEAVYGGVDLEMQHGIPLGRIPITAKSQYWTIPGIPMHGTPLYNISSYIVITTWHPAAGLRDTNWMIALQDDFRRIRKILRGDWSDVVSDPYTDPLYFEATDTAEIDAYFDGYARPSPDNPYLGYYAGVDTEWDGDAPWCVTVSVAPGTGMLVDAARLDLLAHLRSRLAGYVYALHAAMADTDPLAVMGLAPRRWTDTMETEYWTQEFRIGLKPLAYRHLGMRMQDYNDVVNPPSKRRLWEYACFAAKQMAEAVSASRKGKSLSPIEADVRRVAKNVKRLAGDLAKEEAVGYTGPLKPWVRVDGWDKADSATIANFAGSPIPRPSIAHVDRDKAVVYACRDSDATLRILPIARARAAEIRRQV